MTATAVSLGTLVTHIEVKKLIGYSLLDRLKDTYKTLISSLVMCAAVVGIKQLFCSISIPTIILLIIEIITGIAVYIVMSALLKIDVFKELLGLVKGRKR